MSVIKLINDQVYINKINSEKTLMALAVTYIYCSHYFFLMIVKIKKMTQKKLQIEELGARIHIFGILGLISLNFIQSCVIFPIAGWAAMILMITMHGIILSEESKERTKTIFLAIYQLVMLLWFSSLIFVYIYDAYGN